jgi:pSer/pThr/pTyr-binding forkhead associated (FHA) protein
VLRIDGGFAVTEEVGALNGTFVNGNRVDTGVPQPIRDGDKVSFGMVRLVFRD